jgi:flagellar biosynthesis protein FlhA
LSALSCNRRFEQAAGEAPVLVTSAAIRPFVRSPVERFRSQTTVLSQAKSIRGRG